MPLLEAPARSHCPVRCVLSPAKPRTIEEAVVPDKVSVPRALQVLSARSQPGVGYGPAADLVEDVPVVSGEESTSSAEPTEATVIARAT